MDNIHFQQIYNENSTLSNQIYSLITSICLSIKHKKNIIIISDLLRINTHFSPISKVFDLDHLNDYLKKYNILILDHNFIQFDILNIKYGNENEIYDLTSHFINSLNTKNHLFISNKINFDLICSHNNDIKTNKNIDFDISSTKLINKKIYITIKINNTHDFTFEYLTKSGNPIKDININFNNKKFIPLNSWIILEEPEFKLILNEILLNIKFTDHINNQLLEFKNKILYNSLDEKNNDHVIINNLISNNSNVSLNIINMRITEDELKNFSLLNNVDCKTFKQIMTIKYINEIESSIDKTTLTIVLTNELNHFIIYFLEKNNYNFKIIDQFLENENEKQLIHFFDYSISLLCNEVYIGNLSSTITLCLKQLNNNKKNIIFNFQKSEINSLIKNINNENNNLNKDNNLNTENNLKKNIHNSYMENIILNEDNKIIDNLKNKLPNDFNSIIYKNLYDDLVNFNENEASLHYLIHGINEERTYKIKSSNNIEYDKLPIDFNSTIYKEKYNDLHKLNNNDLIIHYLNQGILEKRDYKNTLPPIPLDKLPSDFNVSDYKKLNKDLGNLSDNDAISHYLNHGIIENRTYKNILPHTNLDKLPSDFNVLDYKKLHKDLGNLSDNDAISHYLNHGIIENRTYTNILPHTNLDKLPSDFNTSVYKNLYSDLVFLSDQEVINHYLNHGILEKREYKINIYSNNLPSDFNVLSYKKLNKDLKNLNNSELIFHYLTHGLKEKRSY